MMEILYKGADLVVPVSITEGGEPVAFADVQVKVEFFIKDRLVGTYTKEDDTVLATAISNKCEVLLFSSVTKDYPVGILKGKVTVGITDIRFPDNVRDLVVVIPAYEVREAM